MDKILRLIGLAKRGGNLEAGEEPVGAAARARDARVILVANDAAENTFRRVRHFADAGQCIWLSIPCTKDELGGCIGRTSCAMVAVTDLGLASAIVKKLAEIDPDKYSLSAEKMELKAQRAQERREEAARHEKNLRSGKKKRVTAVPAREETIVTIPAEKSAKPAGEKKEKKSFSKPGYRKSEGGDKKFSKPRAKKPYRKPAEVRFKNSRPVKKGKGSVKK
ncbi:MAG: 50S ribosomal protein L7 [Oscillospiraceae bacterium]|nr:50S ribosomal protein L7 [Oscillospiraceae bacterium]